jgi:hypothetical protein
VADGALADGEVAADPLLEPELPPEPLAALATPYVPPAIPIATAPSASARGNLRALSVIPTSFGWCRAGNSAPLNRRRPT